MLFRKIAILGPGLLGGSLLKAVRQRRVAQVASAWGRRSEAVEEVLRLGLAAEASTDLSEVTRDADLVVLCTPVESFRELGAALCPLLASDAVLTDVGSVKGSVIREMREVLGPAASRFVGSHPMAGSEQSGMAAAREDLFEGAACVVTPVDEVEEFAFERVQTLWRAVGAIVHVMSPREHDEMVASISHVPHIVAAALVHLASGSHPKAFECVGNGFRDTTRVASGSPQLWRHIIASNRPAIMDELTETTALLERFRAAVANQDWDAVEDFLGKACEKRKNFRAKPKVNQGD